jgi:hypothetical protein
VALSPDGPVGEPAVACEPAEPCLVVWTRGEGASRDVVGRYWFPHEEYVGDETLEVAVSSREERYPSVAWNGHDLTWSYLVTWTDEGGDYQTVQARAVHPAGSPRALDDYVVAATTLQLSVGTNTDDHADVAALGPDFVTVWATGRDGPVDIVARRVMLAQGTRDPRGLDLLYVSDADPTERYPAVAASGASLALAVWEAEYANRNVDILGRQVAAAPAAGGGPIALVGRLEEHDGGRDGGIWVTAVEQVTSGTFPCSRAHVYYSGQTRMDASLHEGDRVSVRGERLPEEGTCALGAAELTRQREPGRDVRLYLPSASHGG